jgi:hypothetical protein
MLTQLIQFLDEAIVMVAKINSASNTFTSLSLSFAIVASVICFGFALNFGLSGFISILNGIQAGVENIPSIFNAAGIKLANVCRWEGDIFSQYLAGGRNSSKLDHMTYL